jgi:hypothetical protein
VNQPGSPTAACPSYYVNNPLQPGTQLEFPGCCRQDGTCGYDVDLTIYGGPDFGCGQTVCNGPKPTC